MRIFSTHNLTKKLAVVFFLLFSGATASYAQMQEPVKWSYKINKISDTEAELQFIASIDQGWHLYSQNLSKGGPLPTKFIFDKNAGIALEGKVTEPKPQEEMDEAFGVKVKFFTGKVIFKQKIKRLNDKPVKVTGELEYQACNDGSCVPGNSSFSFSLEGAAVAAVGNTVVADTAPKATASPVVDSSKAVVKAESKQNEGQKHTSLWLFFWMAFLGGLIAILTPCVFPMIPMTVSFFMKSGSKGKIQAFIYGFSIIAIYTLFGTLMAVLFGAEFGNWLSTHWIPNVLFFVIFVIFAISFFGYFEITMPSWMVNKSVANEDKGGLIGTIFMALTLVLVSFSCTGPIVGTVLVAAVGGEILKPIIGMLGFSLAFALPFTLFALFPQWLNKLPKSGGWLNTVKVVLGFVELAFALKFLNVPDQTYHWGILDREIYLAFWIVLSALLGLYLLGKIKFPHDSDYPVIKSFTRFLLAIFSFVFMMYLIPGMWGAPLKGISGWLPPMETQDFDVNAIVREHAVASVGSTQTTELTEVPKYADKGLKLPHGLKGYFDYEQALGIAKKLNKPLFIDFTGHGCTNCREMENRVWSDAQVLKRLRENFVLAALYVDDKTIELPQNEWYKNKDGREVKLLGKKNMELEIEKFKANSQPCYAILDPNGNLLVPTKSYDLNVDNFIKFLDSGLEAYKSK